jgi:hypothetical protein
VSFKQWDLTLALRAAAKAAVPTQRVEIDQDRRIIVVLGNAEGQKQDEGEVPATVDEFEQWKKKHARKA